MTRTLDSLQEVGFHWVYEIVVGKQGKKEYPHR